MSIHLMPPLYVIRHVPKVEVTLYPDADPETTSVDGRVAQQDHDQSWLQAHGGLGNIAEDNISNLSADVSSDTIAYPNKWWRIQRAILLFDTSSIPAGATILSAILSVYSTSKACDFAGSSFAVFSSNPASNTGLVTSDYRRLGSTPLSNAIACGDIDAAGWNEFTLNGAGRAAIAKGSITKLGIREATYDARNTAPGPWAADKSIGFVFNAAETGSNIPKLTVTYQI